MVKLERHIMQAHHHSTRIAARACPAHLTYTLSAAPSHDKAEHPECPRRLYGIQRHLHQQGLDQHQRIFSLPIDNWASHTRLQEALQLVHPAPYLRRLQEICSSLEAGPAMIDDSTFISPGSYEACCQVTHCRKNKEG